MNTVLYFAYGSNMNTGQMAMRCPGARPVGPARLPDFRLVERRHADVEPCEDEDTYGVLWEITEDNLASLDRYEGTPTYYTRDLAIVELVPVGPEADQADPVPVPAYVYQMTERARRTRNADPYAPAYREACAAGAREHMLPVNHFEGT